MSGVPERNRHQLPPIGVLARLLAEHDAGVGPPPPEDPRLDEVRTALVATRSALSSLGSLPDPELPPDVATRWLDAVVGLPAPVAAAPTRGAARPRPRTPPRTRLAAAAALLAVAVLSAGLVAGGATPVAGRGEPAPTTSAIAAVPPLGLARRDLPGAAAAALAAPDLGPLANRELLAGCLGAVGIAGMTTLGGRQVLLDGQAGVLLVLATRVAGRLRLVVVTPDCGAGGTALLADVMVGR